MPCGVLLPTLNQIEALDSSTMRPQFLKEYEAYRIANGFPDVRFMESISLLAQTYQVPVYTRATLKDADARDWVKAMQLDMIVLGGGWPELIPVEIIRLPKVGLLNTHPSLLPEFRGTDIHRWQILHGVKESGATIHYIDETFDTGDIVGQKAVAIAETDTPQQLFEKTAKVSGELMVEVLKQHELVYPNKIAGTAQAARGDKSKYYSRWKWEHTAFMQIDWAQSAQTIVRRVLASTQEDYQYNGIFAYYAGNKWIVREAEYVVCEHDLPSGTIRSINDSEMTIACNRGCLHITQIQPGTPLGYPQEPNTGKALTGKAIAASGKFIVGTKFE